ncbi:MAG: hypothetical protein D6736_20755 [Nitrospinota bacterium]|nr:MAG: hypothetical protein D6736_20755 [Nitrospinota bacterium]
MTRHRDPGWTDQQVVSELIICHYNIGEVLTICHLPLGWNNDNFLLQTADGKAYVLRRYRKQPLPERIAFELALQTTLRRLGIPTPPVILTRNGRQYTMAYGSFWSLSAFMPGDPFQGENREQIREAARFLGHYHATVSSVTLAEEQRWRACCDRSWKTRNRVSFDTIAVPTSSPRLAAEVAKHRAFLLEQGNRLKRGLPLSLYAQLPKLIIHGDYHGGNLKFVRRRIRALLDFDNARFDAKAYDVAVGIYGFCRSQGTLKVSTELGRLFIKEYSRRYPLSTGERQTLFYFLLFRNLFSILALVQQGAGYPEEECLTRIRRRLEILHYLDSEGQQVIETVANG